MKTIHMTLAFLFLLFGPVLAADATSIPGTSDELIEGPMTNLVFANEHPEIVTKPNQTFAETTFYLTNISDSEVVISKVVPSCRCTVANLPSEPWRIGPRESGHFDAKVDLNSKSGTFEKKLEIAFADTNAPRKVLWMRVVMPDDKKTREENMKLAKVDRQAVFKGDCAHCHAEPAQTLSGMALYHAVCAICHEAHPRPSAVPEIRAIRKPITDVAFWKMWITNGKPGTMMPAFAKSQGGPLTDEQIDQLAKAVDKALPASRFAGDPVPQE